jgi:FemAB-related protein (PEP-CTERM system-associated)
MLAHVRSVLFGRFLVSLPYLNSGGVLADDPAIALGLVDRAMALADALDVRYLELRHEHRVEHAKLIESTGKVHMRLAMPRSSEELWRALDPKVRNQIRKAQKLELTVHWGTENLLGEFYDVFARNMRDLGTPVFSRRLFECILRQFPGAAELCVVRQGPQPIAAGLVLHGPGVSEVPSASSLRTHNPTNANMLLYWHLLTRAIEREQRVFDFGRSSRESGTFRFKKQWGAEPHPAVWQYHLREGDIADMRPENAKYQRLIQMWSHLPVGLTRWIGPFIVRGIP